MLDLRDGGQAYIDWKIGRSTVHGLITKLGWQGARESVRVAGEQLGLGSDPEMVKVMRLWEAYAGIVLAQQAGKMNKEESKDKRYAQAALLYREETRFNFLNNLQHNYPSLDALEAALESCYIVSPTPDIFLQSQLTAHLANAQIASAQAAPAIVPAVSAASLIANQTPARRSEEQKAPGGPLEEGTTTAIQETDASFYPLINR
jgi:hypothetical protein